MVLHKSPFTCCALNRVLLEVAWLSFRPFGHVINRFVRLFVPTTQERNRSSSSVFSAIFRFPRLFFLSLFWFLCWLLALPLALLAFLLWFPLQFCRQNYRYSESSGAGDGDALPTMPRIAFPTTLTIAQANVCLLPEFATRLNNLNAPTWRVEEIANRLLNLTNHSNSPVEVETEVTFREGTTSLAETDSLFVTNDSPASSYDSNGDVSNDNVNNNRNHHIVETFPDHLDFLCLCEVFDRDAAKTLIHELHRQFDYIIYDISERPALNLLKALNSGLLFASRYPIVDVEFDKYAYSEGSDGLAMKGVLLVKVLLGTTKDDRGKKLTGYLTHTHLQAKLSSRSSNVQKHQLDWVESRMKQFQDSRRRPEEETVCFDLLTGDLNFDSTSKDEQQLAKHSLFQKFQDPCRDENEKELEWTVGTELLQPRLYDPKISTPSGLKMILSSSPEVRRQFVASTNCGVAGDGDMDGKRRIDYICLAEKTVDVEITMKGFQFVTALATLTDHVPMTMSFAIEEKEKIPLSPPPLTHA